MMWLVFIGALWFVGACVVIAVALIGEDTAAAEREAVLDLLWGEDELELSA